MSEFCPICRARYPSGTDTCPLDGMRLFRRNDPLVGRVVARRYELREKLGAGGMAAVYRAEDLRDGTAVAVKILAAHVVADPVQRIRFLREVEAAKRVQHENVVRVHELGEDGELVFMVMELIDGVTLGQALAPGRFPVRRALLVELQLLSALGHAHSRGVVHRDVKPDNVLLVGGERVKVLDFGLARMKGDLRLTATGEVFGTPAYLSPEQATGGAASGASDQYAAGVLLYEMLTGRPPFVGPADEVLLAHFKTPPRPPSELLGGRGIPAGVEAAVLRMLSKLPRERFADVASAGRELAAQLAALDDEGGLR
jgi:serine/threonine-protein kinase